MPSAITTTRGASWSSSIRARPPSGSTTSGPWTSEASSIRRAASTFAKEDSANNRVTGYRIDAPPNAPRGNTLYARTTAPDGARTIFSPFFTPTLTPFERFECRMGLGYTRWLVRMHGFDFEILVFVPAGASQAILDVKVRNVSAPPGMKLDLVPMVEFSHPDALKNLTNADWVPQTMKGKAVGDAIIQYPHMAEGRRANFLTGDRPFDSFTTDRNHFLGQYGYGTFAAPGGLLEERLDNYEAPRADNGNSIAAILYRLGTLDPGRRSGSSSSWARPTARPTWRRPSPASGIRRGWTRLSGSQRELARLPRPLPRSEDLGRRPGSRHQRPGAPAEPRHLLLVALPVPQSAGLRRGPGHRRARQQPGPDGRPRPTCRRRRGG